MGPSPGELRFHPIEQSVGHGGPVLVARCSQPSDPARRSRDKTHRRTHEVAVRLRYQDDRLVGTDQVDRLLKVLWGGPQHRRTLEELDHSREILGPMGPNVDCHCPSSLAIRRGALIAPPSIVVAEILIPATGPEEAPLHACWSKRTRWVRS